MIIVGGHCAGPSTPRMVGFVATLPHAQMLMRERQRIEREAHPEPSPDEDEDSEVPEMEG